MVSWTVRLDRRWWIVRGPNGGYLAGVLLRAMQSAVGDEGRRPRSLTVHYLEAPAEADVTVDATVERAGRSLSTVTARMWQDGRTIAIAVGAFSTDRRAAEFNDLRMPEVPPPERIERRPYDPAVMPPMAGNFDVRPAIGPLPWTATPDPTTGGWLRLDPPEPLDHPQLAMLTDAWIPAMFNRVPSDAPVAVPTVDLTVHFREPFDPGDDRHVLVVFTTSVGSGGFIEEDGQIWSRDGRLLAQSRQLAVLLPL